jgi:hypothetical protein
MASLEDTMGKVVKFVRASDPHDVAAELTTKCAGLSLTQVVRRNNDWFFDFSNGVGLTLDSLWRIVTPKGIAFSGEDDGQKFGHPVTVDGAARTRDLLAKRTIQEITIRPDTSDLFIRFDGGVSLEIMNMSSGYEAWLFVTPLFEVMAQGGGQLTICSELSST